MNVPLSSVVIILIGHWIGDYLLQGNTVADQKSKSLRWLGLHVLIYSATLSVISYFLFPRVGLLEFLLVNAALHFVTDFFTSRLAVKYKSNPRIFYLIIGFDQLIHSVTLMGTMYFYFGTP